MSNPLTNDLGKELQAEGFKVAAALAGNKGILLVVLYFQIRAGRREEKLIMNQMISMRMK